MYTKASPSRDADGLGSNKGGKQYAFEAGVITHLMATGLMEEKLFMTNMDDSARKLYSKMTGNPKAALNELGKYSTKAVAGAFKKYLGDKDPILGFDTFETMEKMHASGANVHGYKSVVSSLPMDTQGILAHLFKLFEELIENDNMPGSLIAHVFGPVLLRPRTLPMDPLKFMGQAKMQKKIVEMLINNSPFYNPAPPPPRSRGPSDPPPLSPRASPCASR